jgi:hypothetical protein
MKTFWEIGSLSFSDVSSSWAALGENGDTEHLEGLILQKSEFQQKFALKCRVL